MHNSVKLLFTILLCSVPLLGQSQENGQALWKLSSLYGELNLKGSYKKQNETTGTFEEKLESNLLYAGVLLRTSSYVWSPKFLIIDINGQFNPEKIADNYLVTPDHSEVNTLKSIDGRIILFKDKFISIIANAAFNENFSTRENLSDIRNQFTNYGAQMSLKSKRLPLFISYNDGKMVQEEILTGRTFIDLNKTVNARTYWKFSKYDKNEASFNFADQTYEEVLLYRNKTKNYYGAMQNSYSDSAHLINFSSLISNLYRIGYDSTNQFQVVENFKISPVKPIDIIANYNFTNYTDPYNQSNQHNARLLFRHKLYHSLISEAFFVIDNINHTLYKDGQREAGLTLKYSKRIPGGKFNISYSLSRLHKKWTSSTEQIVIKHEEYYLSDGQILLLNRPYIEISSILITDVTGTIIYQEFFDYLLIERNNFIEVQRIPGGLIPNNSSIYVDYTTTQPGDYSFDGHTKVFNSSISFIKNIINIYYLNKQIDYSNLYNTEMLTLNYLNQNLIGFSANFKFGGAGIEYDDYKSTILPYQMTRYFVSLQWFLFKKIQLAMNGNIRDYYMIYEDADRLYTDANLNTTLLISPKSKLDINFGYLKQVGQLMDLDLITAKGEFTIKFSQIHLSARVEWYKRYYITEKIDFSGIYFQVKRIFSKKKEVVTSKQNFDKL